MVWLKVVAEGLEGTSGNGRHHLVLVQRLVKPQSPDIGLIE